METLILRKLDKGDLLQVSMIHKNAFPESALSQLGMEAIRRYYEWQLTGPHDCHAIGVYKMEELLGYCFAGSFNGAMSGFLKNNQKYLGFRIVTHPWLLQNPLVLDRLRLAKRVFRRSKVIANTHTQNTQPSFGVLSIAVNPSQQGLGVGKLLMDDIEAIALEKKFKELNLTVHTDNFRAVKFYESLGWRKVMNSFGNWDGGMQKVLG